MPLYRLLVTLFAFWVLARAALRRDWRTMRQRLVMERPAPGRRLWLHAASNGELASARPVIEALRRLRPDLALLVTCNSETGVALAESWGLEARLAPLDLWWTAARMHRRWGVTAHLAMESELWPHRLLRCPGPVVVLGGRLSAGTARGWRWFGGLQGRVLRRVVFLSAQDAGSRDRFRTAGLPKAACGPVVDLKALYTPPDARDAVLSAAFDRGRTWLAASTHEGEEALVLAAHTTARRSEPALRLILAPRHPRRADAIAAQITEAGFSVARRSLGEPPESAEVYLADTLGEMALLYPLAGRVFIGGTIAPRGGHTPYEPATFGAALIHGPDLANFREPFARLAAAGAAVEIRDAAELARALDSLSDPARQVAQGERARLLLAPEADADSLAETVLRHLDGIA